MSYLFKCLLHDEGDRETWQDIATEYGIPDDVLEDMGKPFYELELECSVDDTGQVTILGIHSTQGGNSAIGGRVVKEG